jgi:hypothetical protein
MANIITNLFDYSYINSAGRSTLSQKVSPPVPLRPLTKPMCRASPVAKCAEGLGDQWRISNRMMLNRMESPAMLTSANTYGLLIRSDILAPPE